MNSLQQKWVQYCSLIISICLILLCCSETQFNSSQNPGQKMYIPFPTLLLQWALCGATLSWAAACSTWAQAMGNSRASADDLGSTNPPAGHGLKCPYPCWVLIISVFSWSCQNHTVLQTERPREPQDCTLANMKDVCWRTHIWKRLQSVRAVVNTDLWHKSVLSVAVWSCDSGKY